MRVHRLYRRIVGRLPVGVAVLRAGDASDSEGWLIVELNTAGRLLFPGDGKDPVGRRLVDFAPEIRTTGVLPACAEALRLNRIAEILDFRSRERAPGAHFSIKIFPLGGPLVGLVFESIPASARGEAALACSNAELAQFAYIASHDLQSPLRKAAAFAEQLRMRLGAGLDETSRDFLSRLERSIAGMQSLLAALLELAQSTSREPVWREIDLETTAAEALDELGDQIARSGASIERSGLPVVLGDPHELRLLIRSLVGNALKFTAAGSAPRIRLRGRTLGDGSRELVVEDEGVGFDMAFADRLFQPFQRLHSRGEFPGNGMGLALCRRIVGRCGGTISVESSVGRGTRFTMVFPAGGRSKVHSTFGGADRRPMIN
jgi:signal transduction histidine kinase